MSQHAIYWNPWPSKLAEDCNPNKHSVAESVEVARSIVARAWNGFHETGMSDVGQGKMAHVLLQITAADDRYLLLTDH